MSPNCWRLEIATFDSSGGCSSSYEGGHETPGACPLAELREGAGTAGFLTVGANTSHIWVSLRQTKSGSRAVATASIGMAHHGMWLPAAAAGRWTSGEPGGVSAVGGTWRSAGWRVGFSLPSPDSPQTGSVVCFMLGSACRMNLFCVLALGYPPSSSSTPLQDIFEEP